MSHNPPGVGSVWAVPHDGCNSCINYATVNINFSWLELYSFLAAFKRLLLYKISCDAWRQISGGSLRPTKGSFWISDWRGGKKKSLITKSIFNRSRRWSAYSAPANNVVHNSPGQRSRLKTVWMWLIALMYLLTCAREELTEFVFCCPWTRELVLMFRK